MDRLYRPDVAMGDPPRGGGPKSGRARQLLSIALWGAIAALGAFAFGLLALHRGESINAAWVVIAALCTYSVAYRFYSRFLASKFFELDDRRATPAERLENGVAGFMAMVAILAIMIILLAVLAAGGQPLGATTREVAERMIFNNRLDAVVALVFMGLVIVVIAPSLREWALIVSRRKPAVMSEAPFVPSALPAGDCAPHPGRRSPLATSKVASSDQHL